MVPAPANPQGSQPPASLGPSLLHAKLVLLKHRAEQVSTPQQRRPWPVTPRRGHVGDKQPRAQADRSTSWWGEGCPPAPRRRAQQTA